MFQGWMQKSHCFLLAAWYTLNALLNTPHSSLQCSLIPRLQLQLDSERLDCFALCCVGVAANIYTGVLRCNTPQDICKGTERGQPQTLKSFPSTSDG